MLIYKGKRKLKFKNIASYSLWADGDRVGNLWWLRLSKKKVRFPFPGRGPTRD